jgi:two-component system cell cycle sensor histidine kinase/response regulator CckA
MDVQLQTIINSLEDAVFSLDENRRITFLNDAAARMFGCEGKRVIGRPAARFPVIAQLLDQLQLAGLRLSPAAPKAVRQLRVTTAAGETLALEAVVTRAASGAKAFDTVALRDGSAREQMERTIYQARQTLVLGSLASGIAHDFNNLLTGVISHLDLALYSPDMPAALKDHLHQAKASARRGAELVSKLQVLSRPAGPKSTPLDLRQTIEEARFVLRRSLGPKIQIQCPPPPADLWLVNADNGQILQTLMNLALNARDAMPEGGVLRVEPANVTLAKSAAHPPRKTGEFVRLTVADTGHAMPPETLNRLFEPCFSSTEASQAGRLGLSITSRLAVEHGGWMEAESQAGHGSRFHLFLPRSAEGPLRDHRPDMPVADGKHYDGHERILVVDDEELVRMVLRTVLAYRGYQISEAADGQDAVRKCADAAPPFDLILIDLHMPRLSGREALKRIREHNPRARAILLSGGLPEREGSFPAELTGVRFLPKPFDNQELVRLVREMLDQRSEAQ